MYIIAHRKIFFTVSGILMVLSLMAIFIWGLNLGIDFKGGSLMEVEYPAGRPDSELLKVELSSVPIGAITLQATGDNGYIVRARDLTEEERAPLLDALSFSGTLELEEKRFTSIGPSIGEELRERALIAITIAVILIIIFIAFAFRHVSRPVKSWKYGLVAIVALIHDIIIPTGLFAVLGKFTDAQVDALFVTALLAILGLSVNDTIVVFDRIRENLSNKISKHFDETVGASLKQTITRSINTSITTLFVLVTLYFLGPDSTKSFALVLSVGLIAGTYSSIFLASPLLVEIEKRQRKR